MEKLGSADPQRIGAYRLLGRLGAGGMGQVFLARSDRGRTVAIKVVRPDLAELQEFRHRFRLEVQAARSVGGAWTAPVLDADIDAPVPWVATGYVAGPSLQRVVSGRPGVPVAAAGAHGPLPERSVRALGAGLARALQDIHRAGLIHRDLKPSNILMTIDGPRVIDFGIARALETVTDGGVTRAGALIGSPGFMSPEQVRGERVTTACDVFCLGAVLAYAATGRLPFGAADSGVHALMYRIAQDDPDLTGVPAALVELIRDCLTKDPAARPATDAVLKRLGETEASEPWLPGALIAELGRHAVGLLDAEDPEAPEDSEGSEGSEGSGAPAARPGGPAPAAMHAPAAAPAPPTPPVPPAAGTPQTPQAPPAPQRPPVPGQGHGLPTLVGPPPGPYGPPTAPQPPYPQQPAPPHPAQGHLLQPAPAHGHGIGQGPTPAYGPPPFATSGPPPSEPAGRRSTLALVAVALVVAIGAGGAVFAFMQEDGRRTTVSPTPSTPSSRSPSGSPSQTDPSPVQHDEGDLPTGYLGTWSGTIDNSSGRSTRELVIQQGEVGDTVLSLTAEGPLGAGDTYRCVFQADLASRPSDGSEVHIGPSTVTAGEPMSSCTPGRPTVLTLLPDGSLRRITDGGESLTYTRTG